MLVEEDDLQCLKKLIILFLGIIPYPLMLIKGRNPKFGV